MLYSQNAIRPHHGLFFEAKPTQLCIGFLLQSYPYESVGRHLPIPASPSRPSATPGGDQTRKKTLSF